MHKAAYLGLLTASLALAGCATDSRPAARTGAISADALPLAVDWFQPQAPLPPSLNPDAIAPGPATTPALADAITLSDAAKSVAFLVWHKDRLLLERYAPGAGPATRTQSQSMHKSVLGLMVALALTDGLIPSLDAPAANWLGTWIPQPLGAITLRHLLDMTSGLALPPPGETGRDSFANRLFNASDIAAVARTAPQVKAPGTAFEYNNVNPQLLVAVLEKASGQPYEALLSRRLWSRIAEHPGALWMDRPGGTPHGYCCLIATARDWLRIGRALLPGTPLLTEAARTALLTPGPNPAYGQLIWHGSPWNKVRAYRPGGPFGVTHSAPYSAPDLVFFDGYGGQRVYIVPSRQLVIVRTGPVMADWDDAALPNAVLRALPA
ncbi:serine hydrolase domain-containing protein [Polymorphobacter sp.]|uniref:serine hydrolase domain-containing protein n=1 Tax=Polymorphobacter sp. TaxID=1909290 RepID=UPI003F71ABF5